MKRWIIALVAVVAVFAAVAGSAFAADPVQSADQSASTGQASLAASSATQIEPSNQNISVRVLSPGDGGSVSQSNSAASSAYAPNTSCSEHEARTFPPPPVDTFGAGIDRYLITHQHLDHLDPGSLRAVAERSPDVVVIAPEPLRDMAEGLSFEGVRPGDRVELPGGAAVRVVRAVHALHPADLGQGPVCRGETMGHEKQAQERLSGKVAWLE